MAMKSKSDKVIIATISCSSASFSYSLTKIDLQSVIFVFKNPIKSKKPILVCKMEQIIASFM